MRRLLPEARDETMERVYEELLLVGPVGGRSGVSLGMVASVDGAAAVAGRTADLGGVADQAAFGALRAAADAILVGAGTVRAENYGPGTGSAARRQQRRAKGLAEVPRLAVVSNRLDLEPSARVFTDPAHPPLLITCARAVAERPDVAAAGEVMVAGEEAVDLTVVPRELASMGLGRVLCEGGPRLNATLYALGLVDEIFLTLTPSLVGGDAARIIGPAPDGAAHPLRDLELLELREHGSELLLRYRVVGDGPVDRL
ncbi:dihydrofolate reductase family protein [Egicoccus sp. AB-alg6-2]|uniref:dihydrofolate reductase family protein n=1 Tax=Egicoccus sp. AB-alg6-2 TaxID=3242692 RepID=UPI00359E32C7